MGEIAIRPMEWGKLSDIDDVEPISEADRECMSELLQVLKRHGREGRFGLTLLHKHFDLAENEIMREEVDVEARTLIIRPVVRNGSDQGTVIETSWQLTETEAAQPRLICRRECYGPSDNHMIVHPKVPAPWSPFD